MRRWIRHVYVDRRVLSSPVTREILGRLPGVPVTPGEDENLRKQFSSLPLSGGKRVLYLTRTESGMVKPCPGTRSPYLCCGYTVINQTLQCPMDCSYCILQDYLDLPVIVFNTNIEDVFRQTDAFLKGSPGRFFRFGTGELTDSLVIDEVTGLSRLLLEFFSVRKNTLLELKTKSDSVRGLAGAPARGVISWSLNPRDIISGEEMGSASLEKRLSAARLCQDWGFLLGFHFDPVLMRPGWENGYRNVIKKIGTTVDARRIAWVSLGTLRFPPELKSRIQTRFPGSSILGEEMIRGLDGKMRCLRPLRTEAYRKMAGWLKDLEPELFVYLCMESPAVWEQVFGESPSSNADLDFRFARSLWKRFPELEMEEPVREAYKDDDPGQNQSRKE